MSNRIPKKTDAVGRDDDLRIKRNRRRNARKADAKAAFGGIRFVPSITPSRKKVNENRPRRAPEGYAFDGRGDRVSLRRHARRVRVSA